MGKKIGFCGEGLITSGAEITIDAQNSWHMLKNIAEGSVFKGLEFEAGDSGAITAFADAGGGQVTVTSAAHDISEDDYISITGTTNYDGLYQVTNVQTNTFEITAAWVADDATGTWIHGTHAVIGEGQGGTYVYLASISATASAPNTTFDFTVINDTITNGLSRRKFSTSTDVGNASVMGMVDASDGDHLSIGVRNITSSGNITINEATFLIFKVA